MTAQCIHWYIVYFQSYYTQGSWLYSKVYVTTTTSAYDYFPGVWGRPLKCSILCIFLHQHDQRKPLFFLYTQFILRKAQGEGTHVIFKKDNNIHQLISRVAVLPRVPTAEVDVWFNARTDIDQIDTNTNTRLMGQRIRKAYG